MISSFKRTLTIFFEIARYLSRQTTSIDALFLLGLMITGCHHSHALDSVLKDDWWL